MALSSSSSSSYAIFMNLLGERRAELRSVGPKGDWDVDGCGNKREAKEMDVRGRCDASALETVSCAHYAQMRQKPRSNSYNY